MADPSLFDFMRIPAETLIALDDRRLHFALQPYHYLIRLTHIVSMAAFFGGIVLLDLRLVGWRRSLALKPFAEQVLPWLHASFPVTVLTGLTLFLYDPVHVGSHAYFAPKLALIVLGLINAFLFHRTSYLEALATDGRLPARARIAGIVSLAIWTAVLVCSSMNVEGVPKVLLR